MTLVYGVDVSNRQNTARPAPHQLDAAAMAAAGVGFGWVKASEGYSYHDPFYAQNLAALTAAGIPAGPYHFARPASTSPLLQAQWFRVIAGTCPLPAALDLEDSWLGSRTENTDWALGWFDSVGDRLRVLYTNRDGVDHHLDPARLVDNGVELWLAAPGAPGGIHGDLGAYHGWPVAVHQYGQGDVPGAGATDLDVMSADTLARYLGHPPSEDDDMQGFQIRTMDDGGTIIVYPGNAEKAWIVHHAETIQKMIDGHTLQPVALDEHDPEVCKKLRADAIQ